MGAKSLRTALIFQKKLKFQIEVFKSIKELLNKGTSEILKVHKTPKKSFKALISTNEHLVTLKNVHGVNVLKIWH
jgi:hypothetical protein